jgi:hypothetical protein
MSTRVKQVSPITRIFNFRNSTARKSGHNFGKTAQVRYTQLRIYGGHCAMPPPPLAGP